MGGKVTAKPVKLTSVQDDVKLVLEHAKKHKLLNSNPIDGKWTCYTPEVAKQKFSQGLDWCGVGVNLFFCNLTNWAVMNQDISKAEAAHYGKQNFGSQPVELTKPIGIAVIGGKNPGPKGEWRRISLDKQTFGFLCEWAALLREEPWGDEQQARCELFEKAALHCPVDFHFFSGSQPDIEQMIFKKSFSIMEEFRKEEEEHAPGGWAVCRLFHAAHMLHKKSLGDLASAGRNSSDDVVDFFKGFSFAKSSEYQKLDKKLAKEALLVYTRFMEAGVEEVLAQARVMLGPKTLLDSQSKLIAISQRVTASTSDSSEIKPRLRFVVEFLFVKLIQGRGCSSLRELNKVEIPMIIKAYTLLTYLQSTYQYERDDVKALSHYVSTPLKWYETFMTPGHGRGTAARVLEPWPNQGLAATWAAYGQPGRFAVRRAATDPGSVSCSHRASRRGGRSVATKDQAQHDDGATLIQEHNDLFLGSLRRYEGSGLPRN